MRWGAAMSIDPRLLKQKLYQAGRIAQRNAIRESMQEDAEELNPYGGHKADPGVRGYPEALKQQLRNTLRLLSLIDSGLTTVDVLGDTIVKDADFVNPLFVSSQTLRTYSVRPEGQEIIQIVFSDRGQPKGLWQTNKNGVSIGRLDLLRRSGNPELCKKVLARDKRGIEHLGPSLGLPNEVCRWLDYRPTSQSAWKYSPSSIVLA
jgi:hypothetical protein